MEIQVRAYTQADLPALIRIWNEVVEDGVAFPQEELLDASSGTRFHRFVDELVRIEVEYTYRYMEAAGCPARLGDALTEQLLHIVTTSRFESIFEVIRHGMSREDAREYIRLLSRYHRTGFFAVFGPAQ